MSSDGEGKPKGQDSGADAAPELTVFVEQLLGDMVSVWDSMYMHVGWQSWQQGWVCWTGHE